MLNTDQLSKLKDIVSKNLRELIEAMGWTQSKFAEMTEISEPALSNYLKGSKNGGRLPPAEYLVGLCTMTEFKERGLELGLDLLISEKFNPKAIIKKNLSAPSVSRREMRHGDFLGNYICYFFDQSKPLYNQEPTESRALRYGVISVYDTYESLTGEMSVRVQAMFFKQTDLAKMLELKATLDAIYKQNSNSSVNSRNLAIENAFVSESKSAYEGTVTFSDHHTFINVQSNNFGDNALIILYSPQKKADADYIGGIGSAVSVARGRAHMPAAQKIILSKYVLGCSNEMIAEYLNMSSVAIDQGKETEAICEFCRRLYSDEDFSKVFDEADKAAMIGRRLDQLAKNYIEKNICCVSSVSEDEDKAVYRLIEKYKDNF